MTTASPAVVFANSCRIHPTVSEQVKCNPRFMQARTFPMPNGEEVRMLMHVKLGQGSLAPRMHLFDDTANSGKVVVGYIGRHLPSNLST